MEQDSGLSDATQPELTLQELRHRDGSAAAELHRIRHSPSFRLGVLFIQAIESPLRIFRLPWDLMVLGIKIIRESKTKSLEPMVKKLTRSILFISGESTDFYRQGRVISLMNEVKLDDPSIDMIMLTIGELGLIRPDKSIQEYSLPSSRRNSSIWGGLLSEQVELLLSAHHPSLVVFDGAYPHRGLTRVLSDRSRHTSVWIQPEVSDVKSHLIKNGGVFDEIVIPNDFLTSINDVATLDLKTTKPILWPAKTKYSRRNAKDELNVDLNTLSVLFHPPDELSSRQTAILHTIFTRLRDEGVVISIKTSEASKRWLRSYPISLMRPIINPYSGSTIQGFDFGICDGTQPAISQMVEAEIPFISVPRLGIKGDIPLLRSKAVEQLGCALVVSDKSETSPVWVVNRMLNPLKRKRMRSFCKRASLGEGTEEFAEWLIDQIEA